MDACMYRPTINEHGEMSIKDTKKELLKIIKREGHVIKKIEWKIQDNIYNNGKLVSCRFLTEEGE